MSIGDLIHQKMGEMTRSERTVASCFLAQQSDFAFFTLDKLAENASVSTTTVIRFCRRLGFPGFKAFQEAVRQDARLLPGLPDKYKRALPLFAEDQLLSETLRRDEDAVEQSLAELNKDTLDRAVDLLSGAARIFTFGMKESFALAHYAQTRFLSVRPEVWLLTGPGEGEVETLLNIKKGDLCVVFLFHRYTRLTRSLLPAIRERGARVLLITDPPFDALRCEADLILPCRVDVGAIKNSFAAPLVLTDYLCGALAFRRGNAALDHMTAAEALFRSGDVVER